jgi:hypothetical protein
MYYSEKEYDKIAEARHLALALVLAIRGRFGTGAEDKANALEALALECMHRLDDLEVDAGPSGPHQGRINRQPPIVPQCWQRRRFRSGRLLDFGGVAR